MISKKSTAAAREALKAANVDAHEVEHFSRLAKEWWDPNGKFKPLHRFNPVRLEYIRDTLCRHFGRDLDAERPLEGLSILDIGCGGGLLCEPLTRLGASVTGIDPSRANIDIAKQHAAEAGLDINYRVTAAEALVKQAESFDMVLAMEVIEHVPNVDAFLSACAKLVKPGGLLLVATINRTLKALAFAIVGAEYVLRWLPRGTHHYDKFVKPEEIAHPLDDAGMEILELQGVIFNPLFMRWQLSTDFSVNYMSLSARPR